MTPGYVYALINPSMPGMVKIGMTSRSPNDRAAELSAATGVPHPFEVAFDVLLPDAAAGEAMLHAHLGHGRVNTGREFFDAPLREVIRAMLLVRDQMAHSGSLAPSQGFEVTPDEGTVSESDWDDLFRAAAEVCIQTGAGSVKLIQRRLSVGYGRAARIIDQLHDAGVIGPPDGSQDRKVLVKLEDLDRICPGQ